jgi:hypothetical protein
VKFIQQCCWCWCGNQHVAVFHVIPFMQADLILVHYPAYFVNDELVTKTRCSMIKCVMTSRRPTAGWCCR